MTNIFPLFPLVPKWCNTKPLKVPNLWVSLLECICFGFLPHIPNIPQVTTLIPYSNKPISPFVTKKEDLQILSMWLTFQHAWTQTSPSLHRNKRPLWSTSAEPLPLHSDHCQTGTPCTTIPPKCLQEQELPALLPQSAIAQTHKCTPPLQNPTHSRHNHKNKASEFALCPWAFSHINKNEWVELVCSYNVYSWSPAVSWKKTETSPSRSSHANSLERLLAWNYLIYAAEED
jgi:hypothetical protein